MQDRIEGFLARLLTDDAFRRQFRADPAAIATREGLSAEDCAAIAAMPVEDLETAAASFAHKREAKRRHGKRSWMDALMGRRRQRVPRG